MKRMGNRNDWWDWGVILLLVAGGTFILWAGVWVAHSRTAAPRGHVAASTAALLALPIASSLSSIAKP